MSILAQISNSKDRTGVRVVIAGVEKVGKTTLAASAPRALLIPLETGYSGVNIQKVPMLTDYDQVMQLFNEIYANLKAGQFPFMSLVFDSGTALERLIHDKVLQRDPNWGKGNGKALTMEAALGGYGKAYQYANELFGNFLRWGDILATEFGVNIIVTCHVFAAKIVDPTHGEYDSWDLLLHSPKNQKTYGKREMITQWADVVGFLHEPLYVTKTDNVSQGFSANKGHVLGVARVPSYVAGNRYGITEAITIPKINGWNALAGAIYQSSGVDVYNRDV